MYRLKAALVGLMGIGMSHAQAISKLQEFSLEGACDVSKEALEAFESKFPKVKGFTDYNEMLSVIQPDVVFVATPNITHADLVIAAAEMGVKGVFCEKPMATNLYDGRRMLEICNTRGVRLVVNHQRRLLPEIARMRELLQRGEIGELELIRASCAGDFLSDGTHLVDTVRFLLGDEPCSWVVGQVHIDPIKPNEPKGMGHAVSGGYRYGHPVESGAMAVVEFASGVRAEFFTGTLQPRGHRYQHYELFGTEGMLRRQGDGQPLQMMRSGSWRQVEAVDKSESSYTWFARTVIHGTPTPLDGESALEDLEIVMGVYESARAHRKLYLPVDQDRFPLELMLSEEVGTKC